MTSATSASSRPLTDSEYLHFEELPNAGRKTRLFRVWSRKHGYDLGLVRWYPRWRQYIFEPEKGTLYNNGCLTDIADRLSYLNTMHGRK